MTTRNPHIDRARELLAMRPHEGEFWGLSAARLAVKEAETVWRQVQNTQQTAEAADLLADCYKACADRTTLTTQARAYNDEAQSWRRIAAETRASVTTTNHELATS